MILLAGALWGPAHAQDAAAGKRKAEACAACHGADGNSTVPQYPILAGQTARYLYLELRDFKEGRRSNPLMQPIAAQLSKADMFDLAAWFASQPLKPADFKADPQAVERGRKKAAEVLCTMCHLGSFSGQNEIPRVAGQHYAYIVKQLTDFREKRRTNDAGNMTSVARNLTDRDIDDLAQYCASIRLGP